MEALTVWSNIFVAIEILICFLGIILNGLVLLTIIKNIFRLSAPSYFILSIAISDLLSCAVAVPFSIRNHFQKAWPFGMAGCQAHAFMIFLFALVSITHLAAISAGKYLTITKSLSRDSYFDKKQVLWIIVVLWVYSFGLSVPPLVGWSRYGLEGINTTCSIKWDSSFAADKAYFGVIFIAGYFLPIAIITFCYYKIYKATKEVVAMAFQMTGFALSVNQAMLRKQHKSAMYFLVVISGFFLCWTAYAIVSFISVLGFKINPVASSAPSVFAKISFLLNPVLYALCFRKFRRRMLLAVPISKGNRAVGPRTRALPSEPMAL